MRISCLPQSTPYIPKTLTVHIDSENDERNLLGLLTAIHCCFPSKDERFHLGARMIEAVESSKE